MQTGLDAARACDVSFILPCLNEARTLAACINAAWECARVHGLAAEVIVADNGSTDGSQAIAAALGARVVHAPERGYGAALRAGFDAAGAPMLVMADSDESYDLRESIALIRLVKCGADLAMGNRFPRFGGDIRPGAMPWKHRWIGNPALSGIGRLLFRSPVGDFHCGMRALSRDAWRRLALRTPGMEFASEMVVKATLRGMRIAEAPITLHKDGRDRPPHLRSWRDGWRHLKFMLCLSPRWTLVLPGAALFLLGAALLAVVGAAPVSIAGVRLDVHTLVAASLMVLVGAQTLLWGVVMRAIGLTGELGQPSANVRRAGSLLSPGRGALLGIGIGLAGLAVIGLPVLAWVRAGLGDLDPQRTLRPMIIGATLIALGVQTAMMSWVAAMLRMARETSR